jgi:DNA-binding NarL/FixJ family response regulator
LPVSDSLSPRDRQVAALIARGLTNRQIANELVISERTADGHMAHILNKLALNTRAQVAVGVLEHRN